MRTDILQREIVVGDAIAYFYKRGWNYGIVYDYQPYIRNAGHRRDTLKVVALGPSFTYSKYSLVIKLHLDRDGNQYELMLLELQRLVSEYYENHNTNNEIKKYIRDNYGRVSRM